MGCNLGKPSARLSKRSRAKGSLGALLSCVSEDGRVACGIASGVGVMRSAMYSMILSISVAACSALQPAQPRMSYQELTARLGEPSQRLSYHDGSTIVTYDNVNYRKLFPDLDAPKSSDDEHISLSMKFEFDKNGFCTLTSVKMETASKYDPRKPNKDGANGVPLTKLPEIGDLAALSEKVGHCGFSDDGTGQLPL
jgi:hypothetical protein